MQKSSMPYLALAALLAGSVMAATALGSPDTSMVAQDSADKSALDHALTREAVPDWVKMRSIQDVTAKQMGNAESGIYYVLTDFQVRTTGQGHDDWRRVAKRVVNRAGLEAAGQLSFSVDPHFETLALHFVHIIRDGKVIDRTGEAKFRLVAQEDDLDDGIVSGAMKAITNLRDVRVGDVVDYAVTTHARSSLWPGHGFQYTTQRFSDPQGLQALRYLWPDGMQPQFRALNSTIAFKQTRLGNMTEWEWTQTDAPATDAEKWVPQTAYQWGMVEWSTMSQWSQVVQWAMPLYAGDESLTDEFAAKLDAIAKAYPAPADRLTEVSRYLQDNIRYVGEEIGEGSYVPRRPRLVLERGYGDCKDKALLLTVALRRLGIEAAPALVSTSSGFALKQELPSPLAFDHVIVRVVLDGKVTWIDATGAHRGGRGLNIVPSDLGYALPLRAGQTDLERMTNFPEHAGKVTVAEHYAIDPDAAVALRFDVETVYTDERADDFRASVASRGATRIAKNNLNFYSKRYAGLKESRTLDIRDDRDANVLTMVEHYELSKADWDKDGLFSKLVTQAYNVDDILPEKQVTPRRNPLGLPSSALREHVIELNVKGKKLAMPDDIDKVVGAIHFRRNSTQVNNGLRMVYTLDTGLEDEVSAGKAREIYDLSTLIDDEAGLAFHFDQSANTADEPKSAVGAELGAYQADLKKIVELSTKGDDQSAGAALALANTILAKLPQASVGAGIMEGIKGGLLAQLRRPVAALASLRAATAQYDGNPAVYHLWLAFELDQLDAPTFNKVLQRTLAVQPDVVKDMPLAWVKQAMRTIQKLPPAQREGVRQDFCIAMVSADWQLTPRSLMGDQILGCAIAAQTKRGQLAAARALLDKSPPASTLASMSSNRTYQALWPDLDRQAGDGFQKALERDLARTVLALKATPDAMDKIQSQMQALGALGRYEAAAELARPVVADMNKIEAAEEEGFWLVNSYSNALMHMGKFDESVAALDKVLALGVDRYPSLVSMAINRLEVLYDAERFQAILDDGAALEKGSGDRISDFGRMWIWAYQACARYALNQTAEGRAIEEKMAAKSSTNQHAMAMALACRGDEAALADQILARLEDEDQRDSTLDLLLVFKGKDMLSPRRQRILQTVARALQTPKVQAAVKRLGRPVNYAGTRQGWPDT